MIYTPDAKKGPETPLSGHRISCKLDFNTFAAIVQPFLFVKVVKKLALKIIVYLIEIHL